MLWGWLLLPAYDGTIWCVLVAIGVGGRIVARMGESVLVPGWL